MPGFNELIRNFDKIRDYMRDFYIYGFRSRNEFKHKSARTYDNEKRRIESYMGEYMKWDYTKSGKNAFISMDCSKISQNPLYAAWKSKAFTANDIMLHFLIPDALRTSQALTVPEITDAVSARSAVVFDVQTVRIKCNEYVALGLLTSEKRGKAIHYRLSPDSFDGFIELAPRLGEAVKFFQGAAAFGETGSYIMDSLGMENELFSFKHYYTAHTLEDGILLDLLAAIRNNRSIEFVNYSEARNRSTRLDGIPLKIFVSAATGRRYVCVYIPKSRRFFCFRLDHIKSVEAVGYCKAATGYRAGLDRNLGKAWGVSFGGRSRPELISMKLYINEQTEGYILDRIKREGHGGELLRLKPNTFLYTKELFDSYDIAPWLKTFTGRILQLEGTNRTIVERFYSDIKRMREMYGD